MKHVGMRRVRSELKDEVKGETLMYIVTGVQNNGMPSTTVCSRVGTLQLYIVLVYVYRLCMYTTPPCMTT